MKDMNLDFYDLCTDNTVRDCSGKYSTKKPVSEDEIIELAGFIARQKLNNRITISGPDSAKKYIEAAVRAEKLEHEAFWVLLMDTKHNVIKFEKMFRGSISSATVHPREVIKTALKYNAAALFIIHNHPSGETEPSQADINLTSSLIKALDYIDVRVLDHFIVGHDIFSFVENDMMPNS